MQTRALTLTLANGLHCRLIHQPDAAQAAALVQVNAGSLQEPDRWPGLAHLLEHLLFCDSAHFRGGERLMPWIQRRGGQVNASTRLGDSAFFFQTAAGELEEGAARLGDMLAAPELAPDDIRRECAAIDAEYRLLQIHAPALCEAALLDLAVPAGKFQRFRVGNKTGFGDNVTELRAALRQFHQRYYAAENCMLWLQGPHSLDALAQMAQECGAGFTRGQSRLPDPPPRAGSLRWRQLVLPGEGRFWLALPLVGEADTLAPSVDALRSFWLDDAPGSLLAHLRDARLCEELDIEWLWREGGCGWLLFKFSAGAINARQACDIEHYFYQHLRAVQSTGSAQREHYYNLAAAEFARRPPLAQLRARALDLASPEAPPDTDAVILSLLRAGPLRLLTTSRLDGAVVRHIQGFTLHTVDGPAQSGDDLQPHAVNTVKNLRSLHEEEAVGNAVRNTASTPAFYFYPRDSRDNDAPAPGPDDARFPLLAVGPGGSPPALLLRPAFFQPLPLDAALMLGRRLRPLLGALRHLGGRGEWQGGQLTLFLPEKSDYAGALVRRIAKVLGDAIVPGEPPPPESIALRQLLSALPQALYPSPAPCRWLAACSGGSGVQREALARALGGLMPLEKLENPAPASGASAVACAGSDRALVLFIPLAQASNVEQAALRALGHLYAPHFYQRLRVEQQVGYAVFARYQQVADIDGILFALQSPHLGWRTLLQRCKDFLRQQTFDEINLDAVRHALRADPADALSQALRRQFGLAVHDEQAIAALRLEDISALHNRLLRQRRKWRVLVGGAGDENQR